MPTEAVIEKEEEPESPNERMTAVHTDSGAVYPEAFPGTDLRYHLRSKTLKESIVLHTRESVKDEYTAAVTAPGLAPELSGDGSVAFYDEAADYYKKKNKKRRFYRTVINNKMTMIQMEQ
jgi:hypothetical protein